MVRGKNNTSGVGLVEIYDLSPAVAAKLANISTRALVGTGDNIVIAGFTLGGNNGGRPDRDAWSRPEPGGDGNIECRWPIRRWSYATAMERC